MDCRSCGAGNAPGRRYCRDCGACLERPCPACHFINAVDDRHCGGCGRRLAAGLGASAAAPPSGALDGAGGEGRFAALSLAGADLGGHGVSPSEIDGLFENILGEEAGERGEEEA